MPPNANPTGTDFSAYGLPPALLTSLAELGYEAARPVQHACLPVLLQGADARVQAPTGSGKTAAFALPILARLRFEPQIQALIIAPTRELASQIAEETRRLARRMPNTKVLTLCGGVPFSRQRRSLQQGAHIVVGTPGRLEEHLRKQSLRLGHLSTLVLDEADRMFEMGFVEQLERVLAHCPSERQTLLFSATLPEQVAALSASYQHEPVSLDLGTPSPSSEAAPQRSELWQPVHSEHALPVLATWLSQQSPESTLVFCETRVRCDQVALALQERGWVASSVHSDLHQSEREHALRLFKAGSCPILVVTDVAARGWDIEHLEAVVNLGLPNNPTTYLHRIGRAGRHGKGSVLNLVSEDHMARARACSEHLGYDIVWNAAASAPHSEEPVPPPRWTTLILSAGKDRKLRPGDIVGALTSEGSITDKDIGAIQIAQRSSYIAVRPAVKERALALLSRSHVKGRRVRAEPARLRLRSRWRGALPLSPLQEGDWGEATARSAKREDGWGGGTPSRPHNLEIPFTGELASGEECADRSFASDPSLEWQFCHTFGGVRRSDGR